MVKIECPEVRDFARSYDETVKGLSSHFVWLNRSKESLALDLKQEGAKERPDEESMTSSTTSNSKHATAARVGSPMGPRGR